MLNPTLGVSKLLEMRLAWPLAHSAMARVAADSNRAPRALKPPLSTSSAQHEFIMVGWRIGVKPARIASTVLRFGDLRYSNRSIAAARSVVNPKNDSADVTLSLE